MEKEIIMDLVDFNPDYHYKLIAVYYKDTNVVRIQLMNTNNNEWEVSIPFYSYKTDVSKIKDTLKHFPGKIDIEKEAILQEKLKELSEKYSNVNK